MKYVGSTSTTVTVTMDRAELHTMIAVMADGCQQLDMISSDGGNDPDTRRECRRMMLQGERIQTFLAHLNDSLKLPPATK
jgi:hypothetical protein